MNIRWYSLILIILIIVSLAITKLHKPAELVSPAESPKNNGQVKSLNTPTFLGFQAASLRNYEPTKVPTRIWGVLDPKISAKAVLIHSLDDNLPLFYQNTHELRPLASLTKILTALVVIEKIGIDKQIPISREAVETEGFAGNLEEGEIYSARDLLKIMLLTSSNDAAAAFEEYLGGKEKFAQILNRRAVALKMNSTVFEDGSGLSDFNAGTARDILTLTKYIIEKHPEILNWTRASEILVQPLNDINARTEYNINDLVERREFLGGKTGTSDAAGENLMTIISLNNKRLAIILLGSDNRIKDMDKLLEWVKKAYAF